MARNNRDRTGSKATDDSPPIPKVLEKTTDSETSFSFVSPTEFVELPSKGLFYPEGHSLHGIDTVEIRYMTAKDEDILTSKALLRKGVAIDRLLKNVIVDSGVRIDDLLIGDKNAILVATRITGYGPEYNTKVGCVACGEVTEFNFMLSVDNFRGLEPTNDVEQTENGTFVTTLPKSEVTVEFKLLNGSDEKAIARQAEMKKKQKLPESSQTDAFRTYIVSVNSSTDKKHINQFINSMPAMDSRFLRKMYTALVPNIDMTQTFACDECGHEEEMEVPLTAEFFWPK